MAYAVYYEWEALGRPLEPARPIRDVVERMKAAFPQAAKTFSWYANEAHYQAEPPQDHTPFSVTGWPTTSPQWWVFATDIMHRPDLGVDCYALFNYWISEARAGRMPWLKYIIWQAKLYDVRNGWKSQANSGHFDHIHLSTRTDFRDVGLGSWSLLPGGPMAMIMYVDDGPKGPGLYASGGSGWWHLDPGEVVPYANRWKITVPADWKKFEHITFGPMCQQFGPYLGTSTQLIAGPKGDKGDPGEDGLDGEDGAPGLGFAPGQTVTVTGPVTVS
jgi:hypothetical protein